MAKKITESRQPNTRHGGEAGRMNDKLLQKGTAMLKQLHKIEGQDVPARYDLARELFDVKNDAEYGDGAVSKLSAFLGWTKVWGYAQIHVVEIWPDRAKFLELVGEQSEDTKPLSWSHWVTLAEVKDGRERGRLVRLAKKKGWEAAKLELKRKSDGSRSGGTADNTSGEPKAAGPLQATTQNVATQIDTLKNDSSAWVKEIPAKMKDAKPAELTGALEEIRRARAELGDMCNELDQCIGLLEKQQKLAAKKQAKSKKAGATAKTRPERRNRRTAA